VEQASRHQELDLFAPSEKTRAISSVQGERNLMQVEEFSLVVGKSARRDGETTAQSPEMKEIETKLCFDHYPYATQA